MIFSDPKFGILISLFIMAISIIVLLKKMQNKFKDRIIRKKIFRVINPGYLSTKKQKRNKLQKISSINLDMKNKKRTNMIISYIYGVSLVYICIVHFEKILLSYATIVFIISLLISNIFFKNIINKKNRKFIADFPEALDLMARSILSGHSIISAIKIVSENTTGILADEFNNINRNIALGANLQEALDAVRNHIDIKEFHYFCIITQVQQKTGGNIAILLSNLATGLRKKITIEKKIRSLSSEPITSAIVIGSLPFIVISIIWLLNPNYLTPLIHQKLGQLIILGCILWQIIGIIIMRKIIKIEI